jgi:hypothetical protein
MLFFDQEEAACSIVRKQCGGGKLDRHAMVRARNICMQLVGS